LGGAWQGSQIVPASWLGISTQDHVEVYDEPYGYYWWIRDQVTSGTFSADGHGGQYIHVIPEHELVCVQTALPYTPTHEAGIVTEETEELIAMLIDGLLD
jgi:CubicO group peptidase (beta-lactamase class C family)